VAVSLDSHIPEQHNEFREIDGTFKKTIKTLDFLRENEISFSVITVPHRENCSYIEDIIDYSF